MFFYKMYDNCLNLVYICINLVVIELVFIIWVNFWYICDDSYVSYK